MAKTVLLNKDLLSILFVLITDCAKAPLSDLCANIKKIKKIQSKRIIIKKIHFTTFKIIGLLVTKKFFRLSIIKNYIINIEKSQNLLYNQVNEQKSRYFSIC